MLLAAVALARRQVARLLHWAADRLFHGEIGEHDVTTLQDALAELHDLQDNIVQRVIDDPDSLRDPELRERLLVSVLYLTDVVSALVDLHDRQLYR